MVFYCRKVGVLPEQGCNPYLSNPQTTKKIELMCYNKDGKSDPAWYFNNLKNPLHPGARCDSGLLDHRALPLSKISNEQKKI
jgi:hypothetical protein